MRSPQHRTEDVNMRTLLFLLAALLPITAAARPVAAVENTHGKIPWFTGTFEEALARAKAENKVLFVDLWTPTCVWCKKLDKDTFSEDSVVAALKDVICLNLDAESTTGRPIARRFGASLFPTMIVLDADGAYREKLSGYLTPV